MCSCDTYNTPAYCRFDSEDPTKYTCDGEFEVNFQYTTRFSGTDSDITNEGPKKDPVDVDGTRSYPIPV